LQTIMQIKYFVPRAGESFSSVLFVLFQVFTIYSQNSPKATDFYLNQWRKSSVRLPFTRKFLKIFLIANKNANKIFCA